MDHSPGFLKLVEEAKSRVREISVAEVLAHRAAGRPFLLVDVREESEWARGRATGAAHLARGVLERDIERLEPDPAAEIVLYCGGGFRSALAADSLQKMGYKNVWSLAGGWRAWTEAAAPVESPARP
ncbi:MAG: rhodanese-like domain-containing protein [Elusimicrobiota bacterium]